MIDNKIINEINSYTESKVNKKKIIHGILHLIVTILVTILSISNDDYSLMLINIPVIIFYFWSINKKYNYIRYNGLDRLTYSIINKNNNYSVYSISFEADPDEYLLLNTKIFESLSDNSHLTSNARVMLDNFILSYYRKNIRTDIKIDSTL